VSEHGRPVARLVPLELDRLAELKHEGRVTVRHATGSIGDLGRPPKRAPGQPALSDVLAEMRNDERF
jgi:antitoxin (DNA-binding transcriptional repressor) of toxin-antitoxin stability system